MRNFSAIAAAGAWTLACGPSSSPVDAEPAPALTGPSLNGKTKSLADHKGKIVLIDFWATWCDPCRAEVPELVKLQTALGPRGFVVLGVSMDEEIQAVAPFAKAAKVNYPIILNGGERAPKGWRVPGLPTAYLVDRDGRMIARYFGAKSLVKLTADVEAAIDK